MYHAQDVARKSFASASYRGMESCTRKSMYRDAMLCKNVCTPRAFVDLLDPCPPVGMRLLCLKTYLLCFLAIPKNLPYYALNFSHYAPEFAQYPM